MIIDKTNFIKLLEMVQLSKIVQLGGVLHDIPFFRNIFLSEAKKRTVLARNLRKKVFTSK